MGSGPCAFAGSGRVRVGPRGEWVAGKKNSAGWVTGFGPDLG